MKIRVFILAAVFWAVLPGEILAKLCFEKEAYKYYLPYFDGKKPTKNENPLLGGIGVTTAVLTSIPFYFVGTVVEISSDCSLVYSRPLNDYSLISASRKKLFYLAYARGKVMLDSAKRAGEHFRAYAEIFGCTKDRDRFSALVAKNFGYIFDEKLPNLGYVSRTEEVIRNSPGLSCEETRYGRPEFLGEQQFFVMSAGSAPFFTGPYSEGTLFPGAAAKPAAAESASADIDIVSLINEPIFYHTQNSRGK